MSQDRTNPVGEGGVEDKEGVEEDTSTECRTSSRTPTPRTRTERQLWAFRRYHGLGPGGAFIEEWTQQEIADALGVSRQTVDRWLNREDIAESFLGHVSPEHRQFLYFLVLYGERERVEEYLALLKLERRLQQKVDSSEDDRSTDGNDDHHFLAGFEGDSLW